MQMQVNIRLGKQCRKVRYLTIVDINVFMIDLR